MTENQENQIKKLREALAKEEQSAESTQEVYDHLPGEVWPWFSYPESWLNASIDQPGTGETDSNSSSEVKTDETATG